MTVVDMSEFTIGMMHDGTSSATRIDAEHGPPGIDGLVVGAVLMTESAPHGGEMHPDGDELLYLISGRIDVVLEEEDRERVVEVRPGQAAVVPKGIWHRVVIREPSHLVHLTPGPGGEHRPVAAE